MLLHTYETVTCGLVLLHNCLLFMTAVPHPHLLYFLEDFYMNSRTLSSDCFVISLTVHSPFVESGACLSWCWISSCPHRVTLAGSLAAGLLSSSALLRTEAQVSAFPSVDGAGPQTLHRLSLIFRR